MRLLVAGLLPFESGKTTLVLGLVEEMKERGLKAGYFKPVAGHNGWFQADTLEYTVSLGVLVGHDVYVVAERLGLTEKAAILNPVDVLSLPIDPFSAKTTPRGYVDLMSSSLGTAVMARFTRLRGGVVEHVYYMVEDNVARLSPVSAELLSRVVEAVAGGGAIERTAARGLEKLLDDPSTYAEVDRFLELLGGYDHLVIEGYNDVSAPTPGSCAADYVVVVAPTRAALYDGRKYCRAVEVIAPGRPWVVRSLSVVEIAGRPIKVFDVHQLGHGAEFKRSVSDILDTITGVRGRDERAF
ncbi:ATPase [Thermogladius sp. KZ2Tp1]|uniref:ATPase n=1 Tax=Thermogladius sp. KZ2Tp1 TaxID=3136289 RepID=UPI003DA81B9D